MWTNRVSTYDGCMTTDAIAPPRNTQRRTAVIWLFIALLGFGAIGAVVVTDMDIASGGGALVMFGLLLGLISVVVSVMYFGRARTWERVVGRDLLVCWRYSRDEWLRWAEAEHEEESSGKLGLFILVAVFALIGGGAVFIADPDAGGIVFLVMLGLIALIGVVAFVSVRSAHARNLARVGEAFVSPLGVLLNGQLHSWSGFGNRLDGIEVREGPTMVLAFQYSYPARQGRQSTVVRVPVPNGQEAVARGLANQLAASRPG